MATLHLRNISKTYGEFAVLREIEISAEDGEFLVLVGPSGCGKSTLLAMIAGLESVTAGTIAIDGQVVNDQPPRDRDIAMVFQSYALYPNLTVERNITFGLEMRRVPRAKRREAARSVAELLQIEHLLARRPGQLSGGQRQRVAMGRALVRDPKIFLFDEPLSNLDARLRVDMRTEIRKLHARLGTTMVYVTHDQIEAMTMATRIVVLDKGVVQQIGSPKEIYDTPANLFVAGFMGSPPMNLLDAEIAHENGRTVLGLRSSNGPKALLPLPSHVDASMVPDRSAVTLGLRPEWLRVVETGAFGPAAIRATVELLEPTGPDVLAIMSAHGHELTVRLPTDTPLRTGQSVNLAVDMDRALLFDAASGVRIRTALARAGSEADLRPAEALAACAGQSSYRPATLTRSGHQ